MVSKDLSSKLKQSKLSMDLYDTNMDMDDQFELDDEDIDNIDKDIEGDDDNTMRSDGLKFNKTFKGSFSNLL